MLISIIKIALVRNDLYSFSNQEKVQNSALEIGIIHPTRHSCHAIIEGFPKYYINNPSSLIETAVSSGGVEVIN